MTTTPPRKLKVFLCHSSHDKPAVQEIYARLKAEGWIDPWLDEEKLFPGQDWDLEIEKAVEETDAVLVFLSDNSVSKEGYIQRELRLILNMADYKPEGTNFILPMRLNDCPLPRRLRSWHYVDNFPEERKEWAYGRLLGSLKLRAKKVGIDVAAILKKKVEQQKEELAEKKRKEKAEKERKEKAAHEAVEKVKQERIAKEKREVEEKARLEKEAEEERDRKAAVEKARQERIGSIKKFFSKNRKRFSVIVGGLALLFLLGYINSSIEFSATPEPTQTPSLVIKQPSATPIRVRITATPALPTSTAIPTTTEIPSSVTMSKIRESGVVVVAIANEFPYGYLDENNKLRGISPDIAQAALEIVFDNEVDIKPIVTEWGDLISGLNAGHFDMIVAAMYITPERCEAVSFGNPDYTVKDSLLVSEGNPFDLHSYADIAANLDVKVSTGNGYVEHNKMLNEGVADEQITLFSNAVAGAAGIRAGQVDAYTGVAATLYGVLDDLGASSGLEVVEDFVDPTPNFGGVVFRQEDVEFVEAYNAALEELKANGTLLEIHNTYPGFGEFTLPGDVVVGDICD